MKEKHYFPSLDSTVAMMNSDNYKNRMIAEYHQTKIRYEELKDLCNSIEAAHRTGKEAPKHDSPFDMLRDQQMAMGEYLHILEVRAIVEGVEL